MTAKDIATGEVTGREYVTGELLVYLKNVSNQAEFAKLISQKGWVVVAYDEPLNLYTVQTNAKNETDLLTNNSEIQKISYVYNVDFNNVSIGPKARTSDPAWSEDATSWNLNAINLSEARDLLANHALNAAIDVGIVDSKFSNKHEDLHFKTLVTESGDEPVGAVAGVRGGLESADIADHGMHVSGIIGALQNNKGTVGISPSLLLNGVDPYNVNGLATDGAVQRSISRLQKSGNKVVNLSLGKEICNRVTGQCSAESKIFPLHQLYTVQSAVKTMYEYISSAGPGNILFVQSSGNDGGNYLNKKMGEIGSASDKIFADHIGHVATALSLKLENDARDNYGDMQNEIAKHSLVVGAFVSLNNIKRITNYTMVPSPKADLLNGNYILAPGGDTGRGVYSTVLPGFFNSGEYDYMYGTSMAAPHVSAVAALLLQINPILKSWEIKALILDNSDTIDGYRALNAEKAVRAALATKNHCGSVTSPVIAGQQGPSYNVQANQSFGVTTVPVPKSRHPYSSYQWETSEDVGNFITTTNPANSMVLKNAGRASVTVRPVLADGTVCSGATSQITVQSPTPLPSIARMTPVDAVAGEIRSFSITGANLPTASPLDVTFEGCSNIVFASGQTANLHQFTCTPQSAGVLTAVIRTQAGAAPLGTFNVDVSAASTNTTIVIEASSFLRGTNVALSTNGFGADTLMNAPPYNAVANAAEWSFNAPAAGQYELFAEYAAALSRPVYISINGSTALKGALSATTGGWYPVNRQRISQGVVQLTSGANTMHMERSDVFPHIKGFTLVPLRAGTFSVPADSSVGTLFAVPASVTNCIFNASGTWKNGTVIYTATGDVNTYPSNWPSYYTWPMATSPFFSLIALKGTVPFYIGNQATLSVTSGQSVFFVANDSYFSNSFAIDNSGALSVSYSCN